VWAIDEKKTLQLVIEKTEAKLFTTRQKFTPPTFRLEGQAVLLSKQLKGVRQGDPLSSVLFNCALEEVFINLKWEGKGVNVNGAWISNLRFADDIVLITKSKEELAEMTRELKDKSKCSRQFLLHCIFYLN